MAEEVVEGIWTERYRPLKLEEVVGQDNTVKRLQHFVKNKELPHVLFAGAAGTGKTTTALCIARELFGDEWRRNLLELNASDERGIDVIRNKVKNFARMRAFGDVPFKLIYLDESDALTREAQQALRRTMENYSKTCRFVLSCNYSSKIIPPIQSRCSVFRFRLLEDGGVQERLKQIAHKEKVSMEGKGLETIIGIAGGDMRTAINLLQTCAASGKKVDEKSVFEVASRANPKDIDEIVEIALKGKFMDARSRLEDLLIKDGLAAEDLIKGIHSSVMNSKIEDERKIGLLDKIGEYEFRIVEGSDPRIQLAALLAQFAE